MNRVASFRSFLPLLILLAAGATSCSKRGTVVDPNFTTPEGKVSADARLVVWPNLPNYILVFRQRLTGDTLINYSKVYDANGSGFKGAIFDRTAATDFEIFRREPNGGVRSFLDHSAKRTERWIQSHWEVYRFFDPLPSSSTPSYIGRGAVLGTVTPESPLTNFAQAGSRTVAFMTLSPSLLPDNRGFRFSWTAVPGAVGYWFHAYTFRSDLSSGQEFILSGIPAPIYDGKSSDAYVGYMTTTTAEFDTTGSDDGEQLFFQQRPNPVFLVRVTAVDAQGQMIGQTPGDASVMPSFQGEGTYGLFFLGRTQISISGTRKRAARRSPGRAS